MIRVLWFSLLVPILIVLLWEDAPDRVIQVAFFGSLALIVVGLATNRLALTCPNCGKRVKLGYSTCHHCGAQVAKPRAIGAPRWQPEEISKECDHCKSAIRPDASVCPVCQRDVPVWSLHEGTWWRNVDGQWLYLDLHSNDLTWVAQEPEIAARDPS